MESYHYTTATIKGKSVGRISESGGGGWGGWGGGGGGSGEKEYGTPSWGHRVDLGFCNPSTSEAIEDMNNSPSITFLLSSSFLLRMGDGL